MELNEEQKKQINKLARSHALKSAVIILKRIPVLVLADLLVSAIDVAYVHNQMFSFFGGMVSAFLIFQSAPAELQKERDRVKGELDKILKQ